MHLLALVDPVDDTYRRPMNRQLTVQKSVTAWPCDLHGGRGAQGPAHHLPGRYLFNIQDSGPDRGLRPFRDSETIEGDEE